MVRPFRSSAEDGNRSIQPYASFFGLVRGFLNWTEPDVPIGGGHIRCSEAGTGRAETLTMTIGFLHTAEVHTRTCTRPVRRWFPSRADCRAQPQGLSEDVPQLHGSGPRDVVTRHVVDVALADDRRADVRAEPGNGIDEPAVRPCGGR
jgi:hypothetical protein